MNSSDLTGINIQWPWSQLLLSGQKSIETRSYKLPDKFKNVRLAIVETPGRLGRMKKNNIITSVVGVVIFSESFLYDSFEHWLADVDRHCVSSNDPDYAFRTGVPKWGWVVSKVIRFDKPLSPPKRIGRIFTNRCVEPDVVI